jgi:hypothetical protein
MPNQFSPLPEPTAYTVKVPKPLYKFLRRIETLEAPYEVILSVDARGEIALKVIKVKKEILQEGT